MEELIKQTASQIVALLKRGEITPLELIDVATKRIEEVESAINAVPTLCLERARDKAKQLKGEHNVTRNRCFLHGIPILVKDNTAVAGVRTTYGSRVYQSNIPAQSDLVVQRLEANGAIVIGKTNIPEFAAGGNTYNEVFGTTYNPWNTRLTPGGSSGGAAAALATGEVWLATGNDFAGSVRIPASFCSIVGLRPTPGRIARGPTRMLYSFLSVEGSMGRNVEDVALMLDAQVGEHALDPLSLPKPETSYRAAIDKEFRPCRIAYSSDLGLARVDGEVKALCAGAVALLEEAGCAVSEAHPDLGDSDWIFETLRAFVYVERVGPLIDTHRDILSANIVANAERGFALSSRELARAQMAHGDLYRRTVSFFTDYDLLICPTAITPPFDAATRHIDQYLGKLFPTYSGWMSLTSAVTLMGCPAISLPCGFTASGLPVGLQIIGAPRQDAQVLATAKFLEDLLGIDHSPIEPKFIGRPLGTGSLAPDERDGNLSNFSKS
jgi:amidase